MSDPIHHLGLLVIDLQNPFLEIISNREKILKRSAFSIEAAALLGCKIAATEQIPEKLGQTNNTIRKSLPGHVPIFQKETFSAIEVKGVDRWIKRNQIDHLLLIGLETPICIYQTAVQALSIKIGVTLLSDCIGERRHEDRPDVLNQLLTMEAHVLPSETVFYSLIGSATHPKFEEFIQLVKSYS